MKIVVTGGAGFIGSHVAGALAGAGHRVLVLDDLSSGKTENLPEGVEFENLDILEADLEKVIKSWSAEAVSHHAAQISVRDSVDDPFGDLRKNIVGTLRLLEACRLAGCGNFIFASTGGALYGEQQTCPAPESHPTYPLSPYGISKLAAEKYIYYYREQYGLRTVSLRYSNVYGPRQDPHGEAGVVAIFCNRLLAGQVPVINGDGLQTRDYVYVKDVARANLNVLERDISGEFNISTGKETDVNTLAELLLKVSGMSVRFEHGPAKSGEQRRSVLDYSLAERTFGWSPEVGLEEGLEKTWSHFKERAARKREKI